MQWLVLEIEVSCMRACSLKTIPFPANWVKAWRQHTKEALALLCRWDWWAFQEGKSTRKNGHSSYYGCHFYRMVRFPGVVKTFMGTSPSSQCIKRNYNSAKPEPSKIVHVEPVKSSVVALKIVNLCNNKTSVIICLQAFEPSKWIFTSIGTTWYFFFLIFIAWHWELRKKM